MNSTNAAAAYVVTGREEVLLPLFWGPLCLPFLGKVHVCFCDEMTVLYARWYRQPSAGTLHQLEVWISVEFLMRLHLRYNRFACLHGHTHRHMRPDYCLLSIDNDFATGGLQAFSNHEVVKAGHTLTPRFMKGAPFLGCFDYELMLAAPSH